MTDGNATALTSCNFWQRRRFSCSLIMLSSVCHATLIPTLCYLTAMWHLIAKYPIVICIRTRIRYLCLLLSCADICRKRDLCRLLSTSHYISLRCHSIHTQSTHSHSGVKSSMYVSQQTKEKHKPIQENNYAAKLPKKRGKKRKREERKM